MTPSLGQTNWTTPTLVPKHQQSTFGTQFGAQFNTQVSRTEGIPSPALKAGGQSNLHKHFPHYPALSHHANQSTQNIRFGNPLLGFLDAAPTTTFLRGINENPLAELIFKDITCFNAPKMILARSWDEFKDIIPLELGNTSITVGSMLVLPRILKKAAEVVTKVPMADLAKVYTKAEIPELAAKTKLAKLAVSGGFMFPFAAAFWAVPHFRNWLTLRRTHTADFQEIIGLKNGKGQVAHNHPTDPEAYKKVMKEQLGKAGRVLAIGTGIGAGLFALFAGLARGKAPGAQLEGTAKKVVDGLFSEFQLAGGKFLGDPGSWQVDGRLAVFLFWALPAYLGWIEAARGKDERIEQSIKAVNSMFWFTFATPLLLKGMFINGLKAPFTGKTLMKGFEELGYNTGITKLAENASLGEKGKAFFDNVIRSKGSLPKLAEIDALKGVDNLALKRLRKVYDITDLAFTAIMLGTTPQLFNRYFTKKRFEKEQQQLQLQPDQTRQAPPLRLDRSEGLMNGNTPFSLSTGMTIPHPMFNAFEAQHQQNVLEPTLV